MRPSDTFIFIFAYTAELASASQPTWPGAAVPYHGGLRPTSGRLARSVPDLRRSSETIIEPRSSSQEGASSQPSSKRTGRGLAAVGYSKREPKRILAAKEAGLIDINIDGEDVLDA